MRVVFLEDVEGVAQGGDIKEVKNGFARNYLIPKSLAVPATHNALQRVQGLSVQAEKDRVKHLTDMQELADHLSGTQVNIEMRAGASGQLYGSVTNAMVAERLGELTEREIDRRIIEIEESIRELGTFEINVRLHSDVQALINVLVYPAGKTPEEYMATLVEAEAEESTEADEVEQAEESEEAGAPEEVEESEPADEPAETDEPAEAEEPEEAVEAEQEDTESEKDEEEQ